EDAGPHPLLEAVVGGGAGDEAGGVQGLPLAAGAQDEEDGIEALPVGAARPAAAEPVGVLVGGQPRLELLPEFVGDAPVIDRFSHAHRPASCITKWIQEL